MRGAARAERAPSFFAYNSRVHVVVYIVAALYIALTAGLVFAYYRERHTGTLLMAMAYGGAAGAALAHMEWWPLVAGFFIAWLIRFVGLDPGAPREPRS